MRTWQVIRNLKPGERVPEGEPRRYPNGDGYIRLRWLLSPNNYVECYEHRVFDGVVTDAEHVHHINGVRDDNRLENLKPMEAREHMRSHGGKWLPFRNVDAAMKAAIAENNRFDRRARIQVMEKLREDGKTIIEIGEVVGLHPSGVSRYLRLGRNYE